jgi:hypothetical protein
MSWRLRPGSKRLLRKRGFEGQAGCTAFGRCPSRTAMPFHPSVRRQMEETGKPRHLGAATVLMAKRSDGSVLTSPGRRSGDPRWKHHGLRRRQPRRLRAAALSRFGRGTRQLGSHVATRAAWQRRQGQRASEPHECLPDETSWQGSARRKPSGGCETLKAERLRPRQSRGRCEGACTMRTEKRTRRADSAEGVMNLKRGVVQGVDDGP